MTEIRLDHNIPLPRRRGAHRIYPFAEMRVGDSFFVPHKGQKRLAAQLVSGARSQGIRASARTVTENGVEGVRCWRIE